MSTPVAGALAVTPLYATAADAIVSWDDPGQTWRSLAYLSSGVTSISAGTGIVVSPSPIVGSGTVSLVVPVAVANGGTGTSTVFTPGSVLFAGPSGVHAQDNTNLFWDDGNNRLGLGTNSPRGAIEVNYAVGDPPPLANTISGGVIFGGSGAVVQIGTRSNPWDSYIQARNAAAAGVAYNLNLNPLGGNVGIGTLTPNSLARLQVQAATDENLLVTGHFTYTSGVALQAVNNAVNANVPMEFRASSFDFTGGNVGIGTPTAGFLLDVNGTARVFGALTALTLNTQNIRDSGGALVLQTGVTNAHYADSHNFINRSNSAYFAVFDAASTRNNSGAWAVISARELKEDIAPYERGLADLVQLQPCVFRYRAGTPFARGEDEPGDLLIGLIADEVEPYLPELVGETVATVGKEEVTVASLTPGNVVYAVINSIKELSRRVEQLEARP